MTDSLTLLLKAQDFLENCVFTNKGIVESNSDPWSSTVYAATNSTCLLALHESSFTSDKKSILIENILTLQVPEGSEKSYSWCSNEGSSVWSTARVLYALLRVRPELINESRVLGAIQWLFNQRNPDGGFGLKRGLPSRPVYTFHTLRALYEAFVDAPPTLGTELKTGAEPSITYLLRSQLTPGVFTNGVDLKPCPTSTLFAMSALDIWDASLGGRIISEHMLAGALAQLDDIKVVPVDWPRFQDQHFVIEIFLPGKVDLLLRFVQPEHHLVKSSIDYLMKNYIPYRSSLGWTFKSGEPIWSWTTGLALVSLFNYHTAIKSKKTTEPIETPNISDTLSENERLRKFILILLTTNGLIVLAILWLLFDRYRVGITAWWRSFYSSILSNINLGISAVAAIIALLIEEYLIGWFRKLLRRLLKKPKVSRSADS